MNFSPGRYMFMQLEGQGRGEALRPKPWPLQNPLLSGLNVVRNN